MTHDPADLSNLRDIALPTPIPWWPPQPGWWLLLAGLLVLVLFGVAWLVRRYRANAYRRAALRALQQTGPEALAALLKRTALAAVPRATVAGLTGNAWAAFLEQTGGFPRSAEVTLTRATLDPARPLDPTGVEAARSAMRRWIRRHRIRR
ncbi:MAG TPA: DUF4381 family protein [Acetobacteraceae bacterium]|jgi:hypothetical protein